MGEQKEGEKKGDAVAAKKDDGTVTVVLKLDLHCEGCAKKVRRSVKNFDGVESVKADRGNNTLTVIGNVDPVKIKERVEEKTKKKVELISPQPKKGKEDGGGNGDKKSDEKSGKKSDDKKTEEKAPKEPPVKTVVLKTRVHCDGCALKIKRIIRKCEGVQDVNVDLQKDLVTVTGTMNMNEILPYLNTKMKRSVEIVPAAKKDDAGSGDKKPKEGGGEKKEGSGEKKEKAGGGEKKEKEGGGGGGGDQKENAKPAAGGGREAGKSGDNANKVEVNKLEHYGYPYGYGGYVYDPSQGHGNGYAMEHWHAPSPQMEYWHAPSPQMFSDENPNACSVM